MTEFKVGDRFIVTGEKTRCCGEEGTIGRINERNTGCHIKLDNGVSGFLYYSEIQPLSTKPMCKRCGEREMNPVCGICGKHTKGEGYHTGGIPRCAECSEKEEENLMEQIIQCEDCKKSIHSDPWFHIVGDKNICADCYDQNEDYQRHTLISMKGKRQFKPQAEISGDHPTSSESLNNESEKADLVITQHTAHIRAQLADSRIVESPKPNPKEGWEEVWSDKWQVGECVIWHADETKIQVEVSQGYEYEVDKCWLHDMRRLVGGRIIVKGKLIYPCLLEATRYQRTITPEPTHYNQPFPLLAGKVESGHKPM